MFQAPPTFLYLFKYYREVGVDPFGYFFKEIFQLFKQNKEWRKIVLLLLS